MVHLERVLLAALVACLVAGCGSTDAPPPEPAEPPAAPLEESADESVAEPPDPCAPFEARAHQIASDDPGCTTDADCACRSGLLFRDCGGAASLTTARALDDVLRESAAAHCSPPGPRCAPRACSVACVSGRCAER